MVADEWEVCLVDEVLEWIDQLDETTHARVVQAIDALAEGGPGLGRPLVDTIIGSTIQNLKRRGGDDQLHAVEGRARGARRAGRR